MKIPDNIYNAVLKSQVTEKVLARCVISCQVHEKNYAESAVKVCIETPDNNSRIKYHVRKMKEWQELENQLLSFAKPVCVYKLSHLIENTNQYFVRYFYFYKVDRFKFITVVEEQDLDRTLPVYDSKDQPEIKEYKQKPYPREFCRTVLSILQKHGLCDDIKREGETL